MGLRNVVARAVEATRPRNWTDHVATLEQKLATIQAERSTVEANLQRAAAEAFADPENGATIAERDALAERLAVLNREYEATQRALDGARLRKADEHQANRDAQRQAKRERVGELLDEYQRHVDDADAALAVLEDALRAAQGAGEQLALTADASAAAPLAVHRLHSLIGHRLQVAGFPASMAFNVRDRPSLRQAMPDRGWLLRLAELDN